MAAFCTIPHTNTTTNHFKHAINAARVGVVGVCKVCAGGGGEVPPLCVGVRVQHSVDYSLSISCVPIVYMRIVRARTVTQN